MIAELLGRTEREMLRGIDGFSGESCMTRWLRAACLFALVSAAASADAAETLRVAKAQAYAYAFLPLDIGIELGIFAKHGLTIEASELDGSGKMHQAMAAGSIDIALGAGSDMAFIAKGAAEKAVAALAGPPLELILVVRPDAPIKSAADLKGKVVGVSAAASLTGWMIRELSRQQGWGPEGVPIFIGSVPARWAALRTGEIEGTVVDLGSGLQAERAGYGRILLHFGTLVTTFHIHAIYATNAIIAAHPDEVRAFLAGWFETIAFMRANKAKTVEIASKVAGFDTDIMARSYDAVMPELSDDGKFDPAALAVLRRSFVELELLDHEPDMSQLYTEAFLPGK
jgi:NitT/TauT family transport system substrate-binding protein